MIRYTLGLAGAVPVVVAELVQPIGEQELMHVHLGDLVLVLPTDVAEDLADAVITALSDRAAAVSLP